MRLFPRLVMSVLTASLLICSAGSHSLAEEAAAMSVIDVTSYGADGSDEFDDTAAIQGAISAAAAGDTVYFPAGTYIVNQGTVSDGIGLKSGVNLLGEDGAVLKVTADDRRALCIDGQTDIVIDNLKFMGKGLRIYGGSSYITIQNCEMEEVRGSWPYSHAVMINENVHHCYFLNNYFHDSGEIFMCWDIKDSEWTGNFFERTHEPIHTVGNSTGNKYIRNKIYYYSRIGIEIQDNATGNIFEDNDIRYELDPEGCYAISFAAPYTHNALIKNNILVGGRTREAYEDGNWGAAVEVMGQVTVENNIMIDFQHGCQVSTGYSLDRESPIIGGPIIRNNLMRNQSEWGIWKTHVTDLMHMKIEGNFIENAQKDGIFINRDHNPGIEITGNMVVRDAGYWNGDTIRLYSGIKLQQNAKTPANSITDNYILLRSDSMPSGFSFYGVYFSRGNTYLPSFADVVVKGNRIVSRAVQSEDADPRLAAKPTGVSFDTYGSMKSVAFVDNYFEGLGVVMKPGRAGDFIATGNVSLDCPDPGQEGFISGEAANRMPMVDAGADQVVAYPNEVRLAGAVVDDDENLEVRWEKFIGVGDVTFEDDSALITTAAFSHPGWYVLKLSVDDGAHRPWDTVLIQVEGSRNVD